MGLHQRYQEFLADNPTTTPATVPGHTMDGSPTTTATVPGHIMDGSPRPFRAGLGRGLLAHDNGTESSESSRLSLAFRRMMQHLHQSPLPAPNPATVPGHTMAGSPAPLGEGAGAGAWLSAEPVQAFIRTHAQILDASFQTVSMSDGLRRQLQQSDYIFSGIKTFHELNEAFPSLLDENGNRKPFHRFLNDVRQVDATYNRHYLRAEYNLAQASAQAAARWHDFEQDAGRYDLQYRTAGDGLVRPEHAALHGITLPMSDPFWRDYYPPNGWNCRCSVVQVRRGKYPATDPSEAQQRARQATQADKRGLFRFNPGYERKTFPDYNPYTIQRCRTCPVTKGEAQLARTNIPNSELCQACRLLRSLAQREQGARLSKQERRQARDYAIQWAKQHLPYVTLPGGEKAQRSFVECPDANDVLIINKRFFTETFTKNLQNPRLAETMLLATKAESWVPNAKFLRIEKGKHHNFDFMVFEAEADHQAIEFKAKIIGNDVIMYNMRLIQKKEAKG